MKGTGAKRNVCPDSCMSTGAKFPVAPVESAPMPMHRSNFFKFGWDEKLDELKTKSTASCRIWKTAGKPRSGPIFDIYRKDRFAYKHEIRERRLDENRVYTNNLHQALIKKTWDGFLEMLAFEI